MARYWSLPSIYLGSGESAEEFSLQVKLTYEANKDRFPSVNLYLRHLLSYALEHDTSLRHSDPVKPK